MTGQPADAGARFAGLHQPGRPFVLPNAWDVASGLLLAAAGFPAVGTTSLGVNAVAGLIDASGTGRAAAVELARQLVRRLSVPLTVDLEGGYSDDPATVAALAAELASLGVAGVNLEDATPDGRLRPPADQARIIEAVAAAAPGLFLNARTDIYWLEIGPAGGRLTEALDRLHVYAEAGAAGVFVPALADLPSIEAVTATVPLPLNLLWRPGLDLARLGQAGVARVSTGSAPYRRALAAGLATALAARDGGDPPAGDLPYPELIEVLRAGTAG